MSGWVAGAVVGSAVIGSVSSSRASSKAKSAQDAQLAFEYEKYDDWKATYGAIQDNLANYYNNLSPEYYAAVGLEAFEQQQQVSMQRIEENFAQRGISDSALSASIEAQAELDAAETRASIRRDAPAAVRQEQSNFLSMGLGSNPAGSVSAALGQQTAYAQNYANQAEMASGQAWGNAVNVVGSAASDYYRGNPVTTGASNAQIAANNPNPVVTPWGGR